MTERAKKRDKKTKTAMSSSSVKGKASCLTKEQKRAKAKADALLEQLLEEHLVWYARDDDPIENQEGRLTWDRLKPVYDSYRANNLGPLCIENCDISAADFLTDEQISHLCFSNVDLGGVSFCADLFHIVFSDCKMDRCEFTRVIQSSFAGAILEDAGFSDAEIIKCNFDRAMFKCAELNNAKFSKCSFKYATLINADLTEISAVDCDFTCADMSYSTLNGASFNGSTLTAAKLYGTARSDWDIGGVKCKYVYWDKKCKERFPPENDFEKNEFTTQYKPYTEFSYTFKEGITPLDLMLATHIVNEINSSDIGFTIKIDNASLRGLNPTLNFIMESGEANRDEAKELFKTVYEHKISLLEEKLQNSAQLLEERTRRTDLAEEQLAEMTAVVKQTFSGEKFGINARQLLVEHLFSPIMEEVFRDDGLIARHVSRKSRNIANFKADDLAQYRYVALFGPGKYADAIPKHDLDLMHACLSNFMKGDCLFVTESELMNTPENSYIRSVYRCFGDHTENEAYVAVATIFRGINDKILKQPVYCELNRKQHGSWDEALNHALERLRTALFMKSLEDFQLKPLPSAKKSLVCPNGSRIRELRNQKVGPMGRACKIKIFREGRVPHVLSKTTLIKAEKGEPITKARLRDVAKVLKVVASRLIFENTVPNRERLKELRAAVFCTEEELLEQFGVSTPIFFSMLEEAKVVPADTLRCVHHHYKQLIGSMADPFSELIDHSATEALVERLQRGSQSVK
jgi:uncharacterized protein YjbI with pentapeptide repeats